MADNYTVRNASGTAITKAAKDIGSGVEADRIRITKSDGSADAEVTTASAALAENAATWLNAAAALYGTDSAASAGSKLVPVRVVSTADPSLKVSHFNGANQTPAGDALARPIYVAEAAVADGGTSTSFLAALAGTKQQVKGSAGALYSITVTNSHSAAQFVQVFNLASASVTVGATAPDMVIEVPPGDVRQLTWPKGLQFSIGITVAATTARANATGAQANTMDVVISYK